MAKRQDALHNKANKKTGRRNAPVQGGRGKATKPKVRYSKRSVASTTISGERSPRAAARNSAHKNEVLANSHIDATLPRTQASEVIGSAARLESPAKSTSMLGVFYELSRTRMAVAQLSAQKLQRSFVALIGCRSPQEFFQLQNQLVKEQAELLFASIYAPFLNQVGHRSDQVKAAS
jgi:Phasin protein